MATAEQNPFVKKVADYVAHHHDAAYVPISARIEAELIDLAPDEAKAFLKDLGVDDSGVSQLIRGTYDPARPADLLHRRRKGSARLDHQERLEGPAGRRRHPHRFRKGLHQGRDCLLRGSHLGSAALLPPAKPANIGSRARSTFSPTATSPCSASTTDGEQKKPRSIPGLFCGLCANQRPSNQRTAGHEHAFGHDQNAVPNNDTVGIRAIGFAFG